MQPQLSKSEGNAEYLPTAYDSTSVRNGLLNDDTGNGRTRVSGLLWLLQSLSTLDGIASLKTSRLASRVSRQYLDGFCLHLFILGLQAQKNFASL